ncbi:MAG: serine hydrolase [Acidimicrobiia bacterium]|nr:serine hydrolase [Acidimicrobiia bacterium]
MSDAQAMTPGRTAFTAVVAAVTVLGVAGCSAAGGLSSVTRGYSQVDLQRDVEAIRDAGAVGVQARVTIEEDEVLVATGGVADLATREPVPADGFYRIASNTKPFTATVVLQLVGEGALSLDDAVGKHLPGVVDGEGYDEDTITVRDLLQHTSGIDDSLNTDAIDPWRTEEAYLRHRRDRYELADLVALAMHYPPKSEPGTRHSYTNTNYLILGMLIEEVSGRPWAEEVTVRIIEPLGLEHTSIPDGPELPDPHAKSYYQFTPGGPMVDVTVMDVSLGGSGGAIISTTQDLTRFFEALLGVDSGPSLLAPFLLAEMQTTVPSQGSGRYGLGLGWSPLPCGDGYWRHGGAVPAYLSYEGFTNERGVVVSISSISANPEHDMAQNEAVSELLTNALCDR